MSIITRNTSCPSFSSHNVKEKPKKNSRKTANISFPQFVPKVITETAQETFSNSKARIVRVIGNALTKPAQDSFRAIVDLFNKDISYAKTFQFFLLLGLFSVSTLISLIPGAFGVGLMAIANIFRAPMTLIKRDKDFLEETLPEDIQKNGLKVCTFNLGLLPNCASAVNGLDCWETRLKIIIDYIENHKENPDCICLQELFAEDAIEELLNNPQIRAKYPYIIAGAGRQTVGFSSGLAILSKYPINEPEFRAFAQLHLEDAASRKGVLSVVLKITQAITIRLIVTHFQAKEDKPSEKLREEELVGIQNLEEMYAEQGDQIILTVGDFNMAKFKKPPKEKQSEQALRLLDLAQNTEKDQKELSEKEISLRVYETEEWKSLVMQKFLSQHIEPALVESTSSNSRISFNDQSSNARSMIGSTRIDGKSLETDHAQVDHCFLYNPSKNPQTAFITGNFSVDKKYGAVKCSDHYPVSARFHFAPK